MLLKQVLIFLLSIIYPQCCLLCGKISKEICCKSCRKDINFKIETNISKDFYFDKHIYFFQYEDEIRNLILNYKFKDKSYLYKFFSEIIIKNKKICRILKSYDIIIPVPIHKKRKSERGYNQSELIARDLAEKIQDIKLENKVVIKKNNTKKQSELSKEERKKNVIDAYEIINSEKIKDKSIVLFDDIYTTGSTVNEISKILKRSGAKKILVVTIAKD